MKCISHNMRDHRTTIMLKVNFGLEGTSDVILTPKLGVAFIFNVQFI